jgi:hypothetical protein
MTHGHTTRRHEGDVLQEAWAGCYASAWKGLICPEAFAHPAKFAKGLAFHLVEHALAEGWLRPGDVVSDPFAGVGLGALPCLLQGIHWLGCELEPKFVALGHANLDLWQQRYGHLPHYGRGVLVQGDSRCLQKVLARADSVEFVLSSPPYAKGCRHTGGVDPQPQYVQGGAVHHVHYGNMPGQVGTTQGDTFWEASRTILEQVYALLKSNGVAMWVVKSYCQEGKIVDFPGQWRRLCERVGLVTLHEHHALLVEEHGMQRDLFGADTQQRTERKSFFRRLHEAKRPDLAINHETVYCMVKPAAQTS